MKACPALTTRVERSLFCLFSPRIGLSMDSIVLQLSEGGLPDIDTAARDRCDTVWRLHIGGRPFLTGYG
jgi:hypothetical protein